MGRLLPAAACCRCGAQDGLAGASGAPVASSRPAVRPAALPQPPSSASHSPPPTSTPCFTTIATSTGIVLDLFCALNPALRRRQLDTFNWPKLWVGFFLSNAGGWTGTG